MYAKNVSLDDLIKALSVTNKKYAHNIEFERYPEPQNKAGTTFAFTLRTIDSKKPGHRLGMPHYGCTTKSGKPYKAKRMPYACWHVHGDYFEALLEINPDASIQTSGSLANPLPKNTIDIDGGNWQDWNIGSAYQPYYMSEACECDE